MKNHFKTITAMLVAAAAMAYVAPSAKAYSYTEGDLFLGFQSAGSTKDYLIYIGNYSNYTTTNGVYTGATINLNTANLSGIGGNIGTAAQIKADLTTAFGAGWYTDATIKIGVIGAFGSDGFGSTNDIFVSDPSATSTTPSWSTHDAGTQDIAANDISNLAGVYGSTSLATSNTGRVQTASTTSSYFDLASGANGTSSVGASFDIFSVPPGIGTTGRSNYLDLQVSSDASGLKPANSNLVLGQFTVGSDGTITYAAPVPEPSTYAIMGIGCLMLVVMARRRVLKAA